MELARQLTWAEERPRLFHYRAKDKLEVDAVIETPDGRVIAVAVRAIVGPSVPGIRTAAALHLAGRC